MVRGQTAHLHPNDLMRLILPQEIFMKGSKYEKVSLLLKEQNKLNEKMNNLVAQQNELLN